MSTLKEKAQSILSEKIQKLVPENIKSGTQIYDIVGTYNKSIFEEFKKLSEDRTKTFKIKFKNEEVLKTAFDNEMTALQFLRSGMSVLSASDSDDVNTIIDKLKGLKCYNIKLKILGNLPILNLGTNIIPITKSENAYTFGLGIYSCNEILSLLNMDNLITELTNFGICDTDNGIFRIYAISLLPNSFGIYKQNDTSAQEPKYYYYNNFSYTNYLECRDVFEQFNSGVDMEFGENLLVPIAEYGSPLNISMIAYVNQSGIDFINGAFKDSLQHFPEVTVNNFIKTNDLTEPGFYKLNFVIYNGDLVRLTITKDLELSIMSDIYDWSQSSEDSFKKVGLDWSTSIQLGTLGSFEMINDQVKLGNYTHNVILNLPADTFLPEFAYTEDEYIEKFNEYISETFEQFGTIEYTKPEVYHLYTEMNNSNFTEDGKLKPQCICNDTGSEIYFILNDDTCENIGNIDTNNKLLKCNIPREKFRAICDYAYLCIGTYDEESSQATVIDKLSPTECLFYPFGESEAYIYKVPQPV